MNPIAGSVFPKWLNKLRVLVGVGLLIGPLYVALLVAYGASTETTDVGYAPIQPIRYSHQLHAGELGIDCRYCHNTVEQAAHAAIPPTQTCINCHAKDHGIRQESAKLTLLRESYYGSERREPGMPIPWVRVHDLPGYAYFSHSAHVTRGVRCVECHGRVDQMEIVYQANPLSMSWCLDCHRDPGARLIPRREPGDPGYVAITDMTWQPEPGTDMVQYAQERIEEWNIRDIEYMQNCSTCHR